MYLSNYFGDTGKSASLRDVTRGSPSCTEGFPRQYRLPVGGMLGRPGWDWDFFWQLAYVNHKWPSHVAKPAHQPNPLVQVF